jgi:predicted O-methyltransferase YrrM
VIAIDSTLWGGAAVDAADRSADTVAIRQEALARDPRVDVVLLPVGDGLTLARVREAGSGDDGPG